LLAFDDTVHEDGAGTLFLTRRLIGRDRRWAVAGERYTASGGVPLQFSQALFCASFNDHRGSKPDRV
jgi:hypothetical protein